MDLRFLAWMTDSVAASAREGMLDRRLAADSERERSDVQPAGRRGCPQVDGEKLEAFHGRGRGLRKGKGSVLFKERTSIVDLRFLAWMTDSVAVIAERPCLIVG